MIEVRIWVYRTSQNYTQEQIASDMAANNCSSAHGWPDQQIIDRHGVLEDFVLVEWHEDETEAEKTKIRKNHKLESAAQVDLDILTSDEINAWLEINQDTTITNARLIKPGNQINLLVTNTSGSTHTATFDSSFLVDHEAQLDNNDANIPDGYGAYLEFIGLPGNKLLLKTLIVRII